MTVILRPISIDDTSNIIKWRNSNEVKRNLFSQNDITEQQHREYFHNFICKGKVMQFIIVADGNDCGTSFLKNIDLDNKIAEFGIFIGDSIYRGKGIGAIATAQTVKIGFQNLPVERIYLSVFSNNMGAIKSYKKAGFKIIKTGEKHTISDGSTVEITKMEVYRAQIMEVL